MLDLQNNGDTNNLELDKLFSTSFELYPKESVQGKVAIDGSNFFQEIFPLLKIKVFYTREDCNKNVEFERTVIYNGCSHCKDDNGILNKIQSDVDKVARANVRIANYLDGCKVAKFDELNIISERSLKEDLMEVKKGNDN